MDWLLDVLPLLKSQDSSYYFRKHVLSVSALAAPVVLKHRTGLAKGLKYAVLVANNAASSRAVKLVQCLLREQDRLFILHFVRDREEIKASREGFLLQYEVQSLPFVWDQSLWGDKERHESHFSQL
jgi:hypothetical protein